MTEINKENRVDNSKYNIIKQICILFLGILIGAVPFLINDRVDKLNVQESICVEMAGSAEKIKIMYEIYVNAVIEEIRGNKAVNQNNTNEQRLQIAEERGKIKKLYESVYKNFDVTPEMKSAMERSGNEQTINYIETMLPIEVYKKIESGDVQIKNIVDGREITLVTEKNIREQVEKESRRVFTDSMNYLNEELNKQVESSLFYKIRKYSRKL